VPLAAMMRAGVLLDLIGLGVVTLVMLVVARIGMR